MGDDSNGQTGTTGSDRKRKVQNHVDSTRLPRSPKVEIRMSSSGVPSWTRGKLIGEGAFGEIYLATNNMTQETFATKCVDVANMQSKLALNNELAVMRKLRGSPYILKLLGDATTKVIKPTSHVLVEILMEYVPGRDVLGQVAMNGGGLQEGIVAAYTRDALRGLVHMHKRGIVHGDIKCANLLVGDDCIKLCDFGGAKILAQGDLVLPRRPRDRDKKERIVVTGTVGWKAPEVEYEVMQDEKSDIYSLGCCVVEMCMGQAPSRDPLMFSMECTSVDSLKEFQDREPMSVDVPPNFSIEASDFVDWCTEFDPVDRPTAEELLRCSWIVNAPPYPKRLTKPLVRSKSVIQKVSTFMGCGF